MPTVLITAPPEAGADLARLLVEKRLAACVNRIDCESTYSWGGEVHEEPEAIYGSTEVLIDIRRVRRRLILSTVLSTRILLAKTDPGNVADLVDLIKAEHPHDTPCIERFDEDVLVGAYEEWREDVTL